MACSKREFRSRSLGDMTHVQALNKTTMLENMYTNAVLLTSSIVRIWADKAT